jgi:HEAT repeat protein
MVMNAARMADTWSGSLPGADRTRRLVEKIKVDRGPEERIQALVELGNSRDYGAVGLLADCCRDPDPEIRRTAVVGLQNLRSGRAVNVLIERLRDKSELPGTRRHAAAALAAIRSYRAIQELRTLHADPGEDSSLRSFIGGELDRAQTLVSPATGPVPSS